jgi:hypothetical protein
MAGEGVKGFAAGAQGSTFAVAAQTEDSMTGVAPDVAVDLAFHLLFGYRAVQSGPTPWQSCPPPSSA